MPDEVAAAPGSPTTLSAPIRGGVGALLGALAAGTAVCLGLGVYARLHVPSGRALTTLGFSDLLHMKAWLTTAAVVIALGQVLSALRLYGRLGTGPASAWVHRWHRSGGAVAVLLTLPVAFHCAWSLGFGTYSTRVLVHSVLGCVFYGLFVAKMLALRIRRPPRWALPWLGGGLALMLAGLWTTSALWFFAHGGTGY